MFMRTVKMHVRPDEVEPFARAYAETIIPAFGAIEGCRSAVLMQSTRSPEDCISLTFWRSEADIRAFEESGRYDDLVSVLSPYFLESYELQVRLTADLRLDYAPSNEPEVRRYRLDDAERTASTEDLIIRMVTLKFRPGMLEPFRTHYEKEVVPLLRTVRGCRRAFLAAPADSINELLSVTEWDSEQAALEYEHGGQFDRILESQREYFAQIVAMSMEEKKRSGRSSATSEDIVVDKHRVLTGRRFS